MESIMPTVKPGNNSGRPRDLRIRAKVLETALALADQHGYRNVTLQAIAIETKVGRPTIYRWWPDKTMLYLEVIASESMTRQPHIKRPDSLKQYLDTTYDMLKGSFGSLCVEVLIDVSNHPALYKQPYRESIVERRQYVQQLLYAFAEQHKKNFCVSIDVVTDMVVGIMWYRLIHKNLPLTTDVANEIHDAVGRMLE